MYISILKECMLAYCFFVLVFVISSWQQSLTLLSHPTKHLVTRTKHVLVPCSRAERALIIKKHVLPFRMSTELTSFYLPAVKPELLLQISSCVIATILIVIRTRSHRVCTMHMFWSAILSVYFRDAPFRSSFNCSVFRVLFRGESKRKQPCSI